MFYSRSYWVRQSADVLTTCFSLHSHPTPKKSNHKRKWKVTDNSLGGTDTWWRAFSVSSLVSQRPPRSGPLRVFRCQLHSLSFSRIFELSTSRCHSSRSAHLALIGKQRTVSLLPECILQGERWQQSLCGKQVMLFLPQGKM